jgi:hypothetical protein
MIVSLTVGHYPLKINITGKSANTTCLKKIEFFMAIILTDKKQYD